MLSKYFDADDIKKDLSLQLTPWLFGIVHFLDLSKKSTEMSHGIQMTARKVTILSHPEMIYLAKLQYGTGLRCIA